jgi:hypothetical protein
MLSAVVLIAFDEGSRYGGSRTSAPIFFKDLQKKGPVSFELLVSEDRHVIE